MKKLCLLCIIIPILGIIPAKAQIDYGQIYERKIRNYHRMSVAGWTMTGIGSGFAMTGFILMADASDRFGNKEDSEEFEDFFQSLGGIAFFSVGVGLLAGGITLGCIGTHKVKKYQGKLNNLSLGLACTPKCRGISITIRF